MDGVNSYLCECLPGFNGTNCTQGKLSIGLFANDVIIIGSMHADWPAHFNVNIENPRADKLGRNDFECIGRHS